MTRCHICKEESLWVCESCEKPMCDDHTSHLYTDAEVCRSCLPVEDEAVERAKAIASGEAICAHCEGKYHGNTPCSDEEEEK